MFIGGNEDTGRYLPMLLNGTKKSTSKEAATGVLRFEGRSVSRCVIASNRFSGAGDKGTLPAPSLAIS